MRFLFMKKGKNERHMSISNPFPFLKQQCTLQGDPNQNFWFQMTVTLKISISDPMLVRPKCVWGVAVFFKNFKQTAEKCNQIFEIWKRFEFWNGVFKFGWLYFYLFVFRS